MKRTIIISVSAMLFIAIALLWLGNSQNSPTVSAITGNFNTSVEIQQSLSGQEANKVESDSENRDWETFGIGPWYNGGSEDRGLDAYDAGPWYNGD